MSDPTDLFALVTGASSGIGAATARALAAQGVNVIAVARRRGRLHELEAACSRTAPHSEAVVCDLSDPRARSVVLEAVVRHGHLDLLVLCAGMPMRRRVQSLSLDDAQRVLDLNYVSPVSMALAALPSMLAHGRGTIVFVSSLVGRLGNAGEAAYSASKFALCGFAESASIDLADTGVDIRLILPGPIDTEQWDVVVGQDPPSYRGERFAPEVVAEAIVASLDSARVEHYVPDLKAVVEMKTSDFEGFRTSMIEALRGERAMELPADS